MFTTSSIPPINHLPNCQRHHFEPQLFPAESQRRCGLPSGPQPRRPRRTRSAPSAVRRVRRLLSSLFSSGMCRRGGQTEDLVTVQGFEKWLKAAPNKAANPVAHNLDLGDPNRLRNLSRRRRASSSSDIDWIGADGAERSYERDGIDKPLDAAARGRGRPPRRSAWRARRSAP